MNKLISIPASDIQIGMFVAHIDRPACQTPFALQGFHVKSETEVLAVRHFCKMIKIVKGRTR